MILSFRDRSTKLLFENRVPRRLPPEILRKARYQLKQLNAAARLDDMRVPPGNKLHALTGSRAGQHAVWINSQWRLVFVWRDGNAADVEITDYHDD
jgi:proteic killer suppression protein